ncbi:UNVERIFIED_CONTAM: hypothetical protein K2H54_058231 [Gekko kuhli]
MKDCDFQDEDSALENKSGESADSFNSDSESGSDSDTEVDEDESNKELEDKAPGSNCVKSDHSSDTTFKVFHFKNNGPEFEGSIDHSATHVKWQVSSLSPVGPVLQNHDPVYYHGVVLLYKAINDHPSLSFRVYVASNNDSFIKDVSRAVKLSGKKFIKIEKPPCQKLLQGGKKYRLISEPEAEITPEEIEFVDDSLLKVKSYIEVYLEQPVELTLSLVEMDSEETVWKAKLRECDWIQHNQNDNEQRRRTGSIRRRKSSNSLSEEELCNKRMKGNDTTDPGSEASGTPDPCLPGHLAPPPAAISTLRRPYWQSAFSPQGRGPAERLTSAFLADWLPQLRHLRPPLSWWWWLAGHMTTCTWVWPTMTTVVPP